MATRLKQRKSKKSNYQPVLELPPLSSEEYLALRDNIAVNGVVVPILVDSDGSKRRIIDGSYRKQIADELGYECPEIVHSGADDEELRALARALNLARRQLNQQQKREIIADQLQETAERSNRWIAKQLGVHPATVGSVRRELEGTAQIVQLEKTVGLDGKYRPKHKQLKPSLRTEAEKTKRQSKCRLIHGDCREQLRHLKTNSVDLVFCDPPYPEVRQRGKEYPKIGETAWFELMDEVVSECKRIVRPKGSAVFVLQPNYEKLGKMRLWLWDFVSRAGRQWNLVQDCWWWATDAMPLAGTQRTTGLMRQSVKMCVWLGAPNCYRNQDAVLWTPAKATIADHATNRYRGDGRLRQGPSGRTYRQAQFAQSVAERGGTTPFNLLPIASGASIGGREGHPAATPYDLAAWWCRYVLPKNGVLLDPMCGSGTSLIAGLDNGARRVIGIDKVKNYLKTAEKWVGA